MAWTLQQKGRLTECPTASQSDHRLARKKHGRTCGLLHALVARRCRAPLVRIRLSKEAETLQPRRVHVQPFHHQCRCVDCSAPRLHEHANSGASSSGSGHHVRKRRSRYALFGPPLCEPLREHHAVHTQDAGKSVPAETPLPPLLSGAHTLIAMRMARVLSYSNRRITCRPRKASRSSSTSRASST